MSGFIPKRVRNARMQTKTDQPGLKMQGNPAAIGRNSVLTRYINKRVQTTWGLCGRPGDMGFRCRYGVDPSTAGKDALMKYCEFCATPDRFCLNEAPKHQGMAGGVGRVNAPGFKCNGCGALSSGRFIHPHFRPGPGPPIVQKVTIDSLMYQRLSTTEGASTYHLFVHWKLPHTWASDPVHLIVSVFLHGKTTPIVPSHIVAYNKNTTDHPFELHYDQKIHDIQVETVYNHDKKDYSNTVLDRPSMRPPSHPIPTPVCPQTGPTNYIDFCGKPNFKPISGYSKKWGFQIFSSTHNPKYAKCVSKYEFIISGEDTVLGKYTIPVGDEGVAFGKYSQVFFLKSCSGFDYATAHCFECDSLLEDTNYKVTINIYTKTGNVIPVSFNNKKTGSSTHKPDPQPTYLPDMPELFVTMYGASFLGIANGSLADASVIIDNVGTNATHLLDAGLAKWYFIRRGSQCFFQNYIQFLTGPITMRNNAKNAMISAGDFRMILPASIDISSTGDSFTNTHWSQTAGGDIPYWKLGQDELHYISPNGPLDYGLPYTTTNAQWKWDDGTSLYVDTPSAEAKKALEKTGCPLILDFIIPLAKKLKQNGLSTTQIEINLQFSVTPYGASRGSMYAWDIGNYIKDDTRKNGKSNFSAALVAGKVSTVLGYYNSKSNTPDFMPQEDNVNGHLDFVNGNIFIGDGSNGSNSARVQGVGCGRPSHFVENDLGNSTDYPVIVDKNSVGSGMYKWGTYTFGQDSFPLDNLHQAFLTIYYINQKIMELNWHIKQGHIKFTHNWKTTDLLPLITHMHSDSESAKPYSLEGRYPTCLTNGQLKKIPGLSIFQSVVSNSTTTTVTHETGGSDWSKGNKVTITGHTGNAANTAMNQVFTIDTVNSSTEAVLKGSGMTQGTYNTGTIVYTRKNRGDPIGLGSNLVDGGGIGYWKYLYNKYMPIECLPDWRKGKGSYKMVRTLSTPNIEKVPNSDDILWDITSKPWNIEQANRSFHLEAKGTNGVPNASNNFDLTDGIQRYNIGAVDFYTTARAQYSEGIWQAWQELYNIGEVRWPAGLVDKNPPYYNTLVDGDDKNNMDIDNIPPDFYTITSGTKGLSVKYSSKYTLPERTTNQQILDIPILTLLGGIYQSLGSGCVPGNKEPLGPPTIMEIKSNTLATPVVGFKLNSIYNTLYGRIAAKYGMDTYTNFLGYTQIKGNIGTSPAMTDLFLRSNNHADYFTPLDGRGFKQVPTNSTNYPNPSDVLNLSMPTDGFYLPIAPFVINGKISLTDIYNDVSDLQGIRWNDANDTHLGSGPQGAIALFSFEYFGGALTPDPRNKSPSGDPWKNTGGFDTSLQDGNTGLSFTRKGRALNTMSYGKFYYVDGDTPIQQANTLNKDNNEKLNPTDSSGKIMCPWIPKGWDVGGDSPAWKRPDVNNRMQGWSAFASKLGGEANLLSVLQNEKGFNPMREFIRAAGVAMGGPNYSGKTKVGLYSIEFLPESWLTEN